MKFKTYKLFYNLLRDIPYYQRGKRLHIVQFFANYIELNRETRK